jgi:PKD repeat protein
MRKQLVMLLVVLALLAVPVAAEEKNWSYTLTSDAFLADTSFGCNLLATDGVDGFDLENIPPPPVYVFDGYFSISGSTKKFKDVRNAKLTPTHDSTTFNLEVFSNATHTITWDPATAALLPTIKTIVMVNDTNPAESYNLMQAGSVTHGPSQKVGSIYIPELYTITVTYELPAPVAAFTGDPIVINKNEAVTFTDTSTPVGLIDSWAWDFGDGVGTSTDQNPVYTYTTSGTSNVSLTATNEAGSDSVVMTDYITVRSDPPVANFTFAPAAPQAGNPVTFTDTSTGTVDTYLWDFGDGATATIADPVHAYAVAGTYTVNLTATNSGGSTSFQDTVTVSVQDAPVALFSADPLSVEANNPVVFHDDSTGYNITAWAWDFGDGVGTSTEQSPSYVYTLSGIYNVSLTVTNAGGSDTMTKNNYITVTGPAPAASFTANVTTGEKPLTVTFTDTSQAFAGASIASWAWDFGDGVGTSVLQNPTYTYPASGSYNVVLTVTDDAIVPASNTSAPTNIMVAGPAPVADFSGTPTLVSVMNGPVQFTDLSTSADFNVTTWNWVFGDGGTSAVQNPAYLYPAAGTYSVTLTVGDDQVPAKTNTTTKTDYIEVVNAPTADFTWPGMPAVTEGYSPVTVTFTDASIADGSAVLSSWAWDFGAAGSSAVQAPGAISFVTPGWYDVSLNVTDNAVGYDVETKQRIVHVMNASPVAGFTTDVTTGDAPLAVTFTDASTGVVDTYAWTFGDGGTSALANPVYTYTTVGVWNASLTVTNDGGSDTFGPVSINVTQPPVPIPDFTANTVSGRSPLTVQFNETITGNWTHVLWEFEDSGTVFTSTEANPEFTFHLIGGHTVSLTAYNDAGSMTEIKLDYIRVSLPVSDGDSGDLSSGTTPTAEPTAVQTIRPDVTPVVTSVPTEPTQVVTPTETTAPVTPVPPTTTDTPVPTTTPGFGIIVAVLGCVAALVVIRR